MFVAFILFIILALEMERSSEYKKRLDNIVGLSKALTLYQRDHRNQLPTKLTDLIPRYVDLTKTQIFFATWKGARVPEIVTEEILQTEGAYVYLGERGLPIGIVLYEKPALESTPASAEQELLILQSNLYFEGYPASILNRQLKQLKQQNPRRKKRKQANLPTRSKSLAK